MRRIILSLICAVTICTANAEINLSKSRIIVDKTSKLDLKGANILASFIKEVTDKDISILPSDTKLKDGDIVIGVANAIKDTTLIEDGFAVKTIDGKVRVISAERGNGAIYGVFDILEKFFGLRYWSYKGYDIPKSRDMILSEDIDYISNPAFIYRQTQSYGTKDENYKYFHRLEEPRELFAENMWVHTFARLIPSSIYGESNPEYFALINGERRPGTQSQLCLTNEDVYELMVQKLDSIFKLDPTKSVISVSQNDGNYTNCTCEKCKAVDEEEGALSGSIIRFINRLAERFPNKEISTLAYTYSVAPPKYVRPLDNVNIMLCDIDCMRQLPLTETPSGREFVEAIEEWSKISNNIFVWDYGINFDNSVSPFPNFHILQSNIQLFHKNSASRLFEQVNGYKGADFSELRGYMLAKLMWNPYIDADKLLEEFVCGYYRDAAPYIYQYLKLQQGGLVTSGLNLWIYDSPVSHKNGFLNQPMIAEYNRLFDRAEEAVKEDSIALNRVRLSRLTLQYSELEIARTLQNQDADILREKLNLFRERTKEFDIRTLNERSNHPQDYCDDYVERYLPSTEINLAKGATIEWITPPSGGYGKDAETILTDGLFGGTSFVESWVGWEGIDAQFILNLGEVKEINSISTDFLHQLGQWVFFPKGVKYEVSTDGVNFTPYGECYKPENRSVKVLFTDFTVTAKPCSAQYIRIFIDGVKDCPWWHYGIGHAGWFFLDEITVK